MATQAYLCVHGHFYQPPRENPWLGTIERQPGAAPRHDWNERVSAECYELNTVARVYDGQGRVIRAVNNFEWMSFNIGPTLLRWLEQYRPLTYRLILEADRRSAAANEGHGNAIAQVYNHMIMPLANRRDQLTQVRWGLADFQARFGRAAEAMWLPETACDAATLDVLSAAGLRYAILAPHQAQEIRRLGEGPWQDVAGGGIDPTRAYRYFITPDGSRFLDLFFYDGPISHAISFERLLAGSAAFADRLQAARVAAREHEELISIATDGETFGHHHPYGERVLAHLLTHEAPARGFRLTNFGRYLAAHPPRWEARIAPGPSGAGTSWSCPHGVERWRAHCGCRGPGPARWNQKWRAPLRETLDWLRDRLAAQFEELASPCFADPWEARDRYIEVILDRSDASLERFFGQVGRGSGGGESRTRALRLLEAQHHALLMYASCAWFFSELSGVETVQGLRCAQRAIELNRDAGGEDLEGAFRDRIAQAHSNKARYRDGGRVHDLLVRPAAVSPERVAAHAAMASLVLGQEGGAAWPDHRIVERSGRRETGPEGSLWAGGLDVIHWPVRQRSPFAVAAVRDGSGMVRCWVAPEAAPPAAGAVLDAICRRFAEGGHAPVQEEFGRLPGARPFSLDDLLEPGRDRIAQEVARNETERFGELARRLNVEAIRLAPVFKADGNALPEPLLSASRQVLAADLREAIRAALREPEAPCGPRPRAILLEARRRGIAVDLAPVRAELQLALETGCARLAAQQDWSALETCRAAMDLARSLNVRLDLMPAQNHFLALLQEVSYQPRQTAAIPPPGAREKLRALAQALSIALPE